jgi:hypothetical protein
MKKGEDGRYYISLQNLPPDITEPVVVKSADATSDVPAAPGCIPTPCCLGWISACVSMTLIAVGCWCFVVWKTLNLDGVCSWWRMGMALLLIVCLIPLADRLLNPSCHRDARVRGQKARTDAKPGESTIAWKDQTDGLHPRPVFDHRRDIVSRNPCHFDFHSLRNHRTKHSAENRRIVRCTHFLTFPFVLSFFC